MTIAALIPPKGTEPLGGAEDALLREAHLARRFGGSTRWDLPTGEVARARFEAATGFVATEAGKCWRIRWTLRMEQRRDRAFGLARVPWRAQLRFGGGAHTTLARREVPHGANRACRSLCERRETRDGWSATDAHRRPSGWWCHRAKQCPRAARSAGCSAPGRCGCSGSTTSHECFGGRPFGHPRHAWTDPCAAASCGHAASTFER